MTNDEILILFSYNHNDVIGFARAIEAKAKAENPATPPQASGQSVSEEPCRKCQGFGYDQSGFARSCPACEGSTLEREADDWLIEKMSKMLAEIAVIVKGPEEALKRHGYDDLPEKVLALQVELEMLRSATPPQASADDVRDAARYRWLVANCFDWSAPGDGDIFDHIELHFESDMLSRDDESVGRAIDAAIAAERADDEGEER